MPDIRYGGTYTEPSSTVVTGMGFTAGPPAGEGWQIVAQLPSAQLPASTSKRMAIVVKGAIVDVTTSGTSQPTRGLAQVCLGSTSGTRSALHQTAIPLREASQTAAGSQRGTPFMFMMVQQSTPSISDPTFGATTNTVTTTFCLWARSCYDFDTSTYLAQFIVADVQWLWIDMDAADPDVLAEVYRPATPQLLSNTASGVMVFTNNPGSAGNKLLHIGCISYTPRQVLLSAPAFEWGHSTTAGSFTGFNPVLPTGAPLRWGLNRAAGVPPSFNTLTVQHGCLWYGVHPGGVYLPAVRGTDRLGTSGNAATWTQVRAATILTIKLDALLDVFSRTETSVANASTSISSTAYEWFNIFVPLERPQAAITSGPTAFIHGIVQSVGTEFSTAWISTNVAGGITNINAFVGTDQTRQEGCSVMQWGPIPFTPTTPDVQVRAHFPGAPTNQANVLRNVNNVTIVTAFLTKDPSNLPQPPDTDPPPTWVNWTGAEATGVVGLTLPPFEPDGAQQMGYVKPRQARIDGATGYGRTWPLFAQPRRTFTVQWTLSREADIGTLRTYLRGNNCFKIKDPLNTATQIVVAQVAPYEVSWDGRYSVGRVIVQVAELIWTTS
jgi:hypothetical protein